MALPTPLMNDEIWNWKYKAMSSTKLVQMGQFKMEQISFKYGAKI